MWRPFHSTTVLMFFWMGLLYVQAGAGPFNVLVVANEQDAASLEIASVYMEERNIPPGHLVRVSLDPTNHSISPSTFTNDLFSVITNAIVTKNLDQQIDFIALCWRMPYQVFWSGILQNGIAPALFYGLKYPIYCGIPGSAFSPYFDTERAYHASEYGGNRYLAFHVTGTQLEDTETMIQRSVMADGQQPPGTAYLFRTTDTLRAIQWTFFEDTAYTLNLLSSPCTNQIIYGNPGAPYSDVMGITAGLTGYTNALNNMTLLPGSFGHHLTSFGGELDGSRTQMLILEFIDQGASGSYGTITEPCAYNQKFPLPDAHYRYARGFSMAESLYMSVETPYEGTFVGDPLCQPYTDPGQFSVSGLVSNQTLSGLVQFTNTLYHPENPTRYNAVELFVDGVWYQAITNLPAFAGNEISVEVTNRSASVIVGSGDDLNTITTALADQLNSSFPPFSPRYIDASGKEDQLFFAQLNQGESADGLAYAATVSLGSGSEVGYRVRTFRDGILHPSPFVAMQRLTLQGAVNFGDVLSCEITRLDGSNITVSTTISTDNRVTLIQNLIDEINATLELQTPSGCSAEYLVNEPLLNQTAFHLKARTNSWPGSNLHVTYTRNGSTLNTSGSGVFSFNASSMVARNMLFIEHGLTNLTTHVSLDTTSLPNGPAELTLVGYEGNAVQVQTTYTVPVIISNSSFTCNLTYTGLSQQALQGTVFPLEVTATGSLASVTQLMLVAEGKLIGSVSNKTSHTFMLDSALLGSGRIRCQAMAYDSLGTVARSEWVVLNTFRDLDADGLGDHWETFYLGSTGSTDAASADMDLDGATNADEFIAHTDPLDSDDVYKVFISYASSNEMLRIHWQENTQRVYRLLENKDPLTLPHWQPVIDWTIGTNVLRELELIPSPSSPVFYKGEVRFP